MKNIQKIVFIPVLAVLTLTAYSQGYHVRIGVIGNSITHGMSYPNPETDAYPGQLETLLEDVYGDTCMVQNFGLTTTTMLKNGDVSYWDTQHLRNYLAWAPEICFILLGTNDTKPQNWDVHGDEFIGDYLSMIDTIKMRNPSTKFMVGYPPPAFAVEWGIRDSIIVNGVIPAIDSVLEVIDAELVDFYYPLLDSAYLFPDNIHPSLEGSHVMAEMIFKKMIETDIVHETDTGLTFITSFKTGDTPLAVGDSTTLNWTTINADSVMLNGEIVSASGSLKISPPITTEYTMLAMGPLRNDTISITQEMYTPELSRLRIYPYKITGYTGVPLYFKLIYYDQIDKMITDTTYDVSWEIVSGNAYLTDENDTAAYVISESVDTSLLVVSFEDLTDTTIVITILNISGIVSDMYESDISIFPNPCRDILNVRIEENPSPLSIRLYDLSGVLHIEKKVEGNRKESQTYRLKTDNLPQGNYILNIESSGKIYSGKIYIQRN